MTVFLGIVLVLLGIAIAIFINKVSIKAYSRGWKDALEVTLSLTKSQYIQKHHIEEFLEKQLKELA